MKKVLSTLWLSVLFSQSMAQSVRPTTGTLLADPMLPLYLIASAVVLLLVFVIALTVYVVRVLNLLTHGVSPESKLTSAPELQRAGWWQKFLEKANASVPVEQEKAIEMEHSYDGIRELDNHLPPWWTWLFYGTIAWGVVYFVMFHLTDSLPLSEEEYKRELALAEEQVRQFHASQPQSVIDENTLEYHQDAAIIGNGKIIFENNNCGGCHRADGGGNSIGPNLADDYWLHGGETKNVFLTIKNGVVEKGMPAWGKSMSAQDVRDVTFFVMSLQGTNPPDAKAPQGEIFRQVKISADTVDSQAGL